MRNVSIILPQEGAIFCQGPRPLELDVQGVPHEVTDAMVAKLVRDLATHPRGLTLGQSDGFGGCAHFFMKFPTLVAYAAERGISTPIPVAPQWPHHGSGGGAPSPRRYFVDGVETNENGQPLHPQPAAREALKTDGQFREVLA